MTNHKIKPHGIILAGMQSSSGKTAVTCMLLSALKTRGVCVQPFKVGPDFIDPGYHSFYSDFTSRNLDSWMMGDEGIIDEVKACGSGRISIVEGVMGLFDGSDVRSDEGSTMALARLLGWPVILVVPAAKAGRSLYAAIKGFLDEAGPHSIVGLILNQVSGASHAEYLKKALVHLRIPVLGAIPMNDQLRWPERHLGLQASPEMSLPQPEVFAKMAEEFLDIDQVVSVVTPAPKSISKKSKIQPHKRIAIARDEVFHFYYEANLDFLRRNHVELIEFSPLKDPGLPANIEGVIFGGGFPEVFATELSKNHSMKESVRTAIEAGVPCYAECGGLMYLSEELVSLDGIRHSMVGSIPGKSQMTPRLNHFGYCTCEIKNGFSMRGHEFHYSKWNDEESRANLWSVTRKSTGNSRVEGYRNKNLMASYVHLYWPNAAKLFNDLFGLNSDKLHAARQTALSQ